MRQDEKTKIMPTPKKEDIEKRLGRASAINTARKGDGGFVPARQARTENKAPEVRRKEGARAEEPQPLREKVKKETNVEITYTIPQRVDAPQETSPNASVVLQLSTAIEKKLGFVPKTYGIGGGTVAAYFRQKGYDAALWTTLDGTMHSPNEYSSIENTQKDASVFAELMSNAT
jgi:acetylornithine deacetylase/succinyl-diaminopimelate desuccinylase-like protein